MSFVLTKTEKTNRLINQTSPYLLQHAHNLVDWYPWSDEAFELAKQKDKPVFLSIGYSTCHWCHVMERESFMDEDTAKILNEHFIPVKVDREERPDIDAVYMQAVQAMTGTGGWPLSIFLSPEGKAFYGGTYFPPHDIPGHPSFKRILLMVADAWKNNRTQILDTSNNINRILESLNKQTARSILSVNILKKAKAELESTFDDVYGGFGNAPKFPQPASLLFLLRYWYRNSDTKALEMVLKTLDDMAKGGIYDHLGGGFHRYSTDSCWLVPHFEKMLYDQALLGKTYIVAYQITKDEKYSKIASEIFDYVLRDMRDEKGGFCSAEDADSEGGEGRYYVWRRGEVEQLLDKEQARILNEYYGITESGNFENCTNILNIHKSRKDIEEKYGIDFIEIENFLSKARTKLLAQRQKRPRPFRDDKVITGWNGLMISSLAVGGAILIKPKYIQAAEEAAQFVLSSLQTDGRIRRYYRGGKTLGFGVLDDYAFLISGLIDLYEADFDVKWLSEAKILALKMIELFSNSNYRGLYLTGNDTKNINARIQSAYDGVIPSGNSIAALALLRLGRLTMNNVFIKQARNILKAYSSQLEKSPLSLCSMLSALDYWIGPTQEIVIAGDSNHKDTQHMMNLVRNRYLPNSVIIYHKNDQGQLLYDTIPFIENQNATNGRPTAYVCRDYVCSKPVNSLNDLEEVLQNQKEC